VRQFRDFKSRPRVLAFTPGGGRLLVTAGNVVQAWDLASGVERGTSGLAHGVVAAAFAPDGRWAVVASGDTLATWEPGSSMRLWQAALPGVTAATVLADGRRVLTGGRDGSVILWDSGTGAELLRFAAPGPVRALAVTRDGRAVLLAAEKADAVVLQQWELPAEAPGAAGEPSRP
jgi:WD40 repeat protein